MSSTMRFDTWQDSNGVLVASGAGGKFSAPGSIVQVVTATDTTNRSTSSSTYVDAGISISITPKFATSTLIIQWTGLLRTDNAASSVGSRVQLTDASNNTLSGAQDFRFYLGASGDFNDYALGGFARAVISATDTSSRTYKLRYRKEGANGNSYIDNASNSGILTVMEVAG